MEQYTLSILVENTAGVLSQVTRLFSRKGYNIESLAVGVTDNPEISRITIIALGNDLMIRQLSNQLSKLLPVISVRVLSDQNSVQRDLVLVKVKTENMAERAEIIQIVDIFRASILDIGRGSLTVAIVGDSEKSGAMLNLLEEFGILEIARTGMVALERGSGTIYDSNKDKEEFSYGKNVL